MTSRQRLEVALRGGRPDRVPCCAIYDVGYFMPAIGRDQREFLFASHAEAIRFTEESFLRHEVDGMFVHWGGNDDYLARHDIERGPGDWIITNRETGEVQRLMPDGCWADADGAPLLHAPSNKGVSLMRTEDDLAKLPPVPTVAEIENMKRFCNLSYMVEKYPDHHFSIQAASPMVHALGYCGGYVEGLLTMAETPELFGKLLAHSVASQRAHLQAAAAAGAHSVWFTSYYQGADTISPKTYAEVVFPYEQAVCQEARDAGLFVLNWYLGDLMPMLDQVMRLPLDALVLEQGRKGYETDPVAIRERVGPHFCLFGYGYEQDYCEFRRERITAELQRQIEGAGRGGAFVAGTPIMPPDARPDAVDFYFAEARRLGQY